MKEVEGYCMTCGRLFGDEEACQYCGTSIGPLNSPLSLEVGTLLKDQYLIGAELGHSQWSIVYLGVDKTLQRRVAIKEFFPRMQAERTSDGMIRVAARKTFEENKVRFMQTSEVLALLGEQEYIVNIWDYFEANGTAYRVMEYLEGHDMEEELAEEGPLNEQSIITLGGHLLDALKLIHAQGYIHRDIRPEKIYTFKEQIKLLDFETEYSYCHVMKDMTDQKYAPLEKILGTVHQGAWTDIYGLGATLYRLATGKYPPPAVAQIMGLETLRDPREYGVTEKLSELLLSTMKIKIHERPQSAEALQEAFLELLDPNLLLLYQKIYMENVEEDLEQRCNKGDAEACFNLGMSYYEGDEDERDLEKCKVFFEKACEYDHSKSCLLLALMYHEGLGVEEDHKKERKLLDKACEGNEMDACFNLGLLYYRGVGGRKNYRKARALWEKACNGGKIVACNNLGIAYIEGKGGKKDYRKAKVLFKKACDEGSRMACRHLAIMYLQGLGGEVDYDKAGEFMKKAEEGNESESE